MSEDYCELCELPLFTCVHGMPPAPVEPPAAPTARVTKSRVGQAKSTQSPTARTSTRKSAGSEVPVRRAPRKWHSADMFVPHVMVVLQEAGGEMDNDAFFAALEERVQEVLLPGDLQSTPEGELRWRRAARVARRDLAGAGLMLTGTPGMWQLTAAGLEYDPAAD